MHANIHVHGPPQGGPSVLQGATAEGVTEFMAHEAIVPRSIDPARKRRQASSHGELVLVLVLVHTLHAWSRQGAACWNSAGELQEHASHAPQACTSWE